MRCKLGKYPKSIQDLIHNRISSDEPIAWLIYRLNSATHADLLHRVFVCACTLFSPLFSVLRLLFQSSVICTLSSEPAASVCGLAPVNLPRRPTRLVSYYAFFKGWLLLSQPPSCLSLPTSFPTEPQFWDLSWRSGLFPFPQRTLSPAVCLP